MTIENNLKRIADALEALVGAQGIVPGADEETTAEAPPKKAAKKKSTKKAAKKAPAKSKSKPAAEPAEEKRLTIKNDVRPVLKRLRDEVNHAAVKSLLKKYNAQTIQQLDEEDYPKIIADALEDLE